MYFTEEYQRMLLARAKQMEKERSEMPPTSPEAFIAQVRALANRSQEGKSRSERKRR